MRAASRPPIFHPAAVVASSLLGACLYALYAALRFPGDRLANQYLYVVPIVVPFVAFLFDRAERLRQSSRLRRVVDALVVGTAMWRAIGDVPFVSGHALFLTYALLSSRSRTAQATAGIVMLEVGYLKYFVWHDWITPTTGIILGSVAASGLRLASSK
jgi:hypothetical protein